MTMSVKAVVESAIRRWPVHPGAEVFPLGALDDLQADIEQNGLLEPIVVWQDDHDNEWLLDGRRRLIAMDRAGIPLREWNIRRLCNCNPIATIIGLNIRRRHLSKQQEADFIVAAVKAGKKPDQAEPVSHKGGRGQSPILAIVISILCSAH